MTRPPRFVTTCLWGTLCGAALGAARTRAAALHLLAKGRTLEAAGVPSLPGPDHWGTLGAWQSPAAGALFFGLSLGLGTSALAALWVRATDRPGAGSRSWAPWALLLAPLASGLAGDWGLTGALAVTALAAIGPIGTRPARSNAPHTARRMICAALVALGLLPWLQAPEGAFTRFRDRWLLSGPGLSVNRFYYRWTLYPAEVLKPLSATSQPVADVRALPVFAARVFAEQALPLRVLALVAPADGADFAVGLQGQAPVLVAGSARAVWPGTSSRQRLVWQHFCRQADPAAPLRTATATALFVGCPLGLAWALGSGCLWVAARWAPGRAAAPFALAGLLAGAVAAAGTPPAGEKTLAALSRAPAVETVRAALASDSPLLRYYGARAAATLGSAGAAPLMDALRDPVINIRYRAAESLGAAVAPGVRDALLAVVRGPDEWYVKERAYAALWRLGWRPVTL